MPESHYQFDIGAYLFRENGEFHHDSYAIYIALGNLRGIVSRSYIK
jgi:hypothetical protein